MESLISLFKIFLGLFIKQAKPLESLEAVTEQVFRSSVTSIESRQKENYIICNGDKVNIKWAKVVRWDEPGGLFCDPEQYRARRGKRRPNMFVAHWDACLNSRSMAKVLKVRGLSVHFAIDNDGTIYQLLDTRHIAWHARGVNTTSVGVEITNAVHLKYQDWYVKNGFGPRPVVSDTMVHGQILNEHLGFYPIQIEAYKALTRAVCKYYDLPYSVPMDKKTNRMLLGVSPKVIRKTFRGIVGHFHVNPGKNDPAGLDLELIAKELAEERK